MVISQVLKDTEKKLERIENGAFEARELVMEFLGVSRLDLMVNGALEAERERLESLNAAVQRRLNGEPLCYILNRAEFMSLPFELNRETLIPRADTETLVEAVLERMGDRKLYIADLCTGSGCIAVSLCYYAKNCICRGFDISEKALEAAGHNAVVNGVSERCSFERLDVMNEIPEGKYDIVTANPPYIESEVIPTLQREVKDYEPIAALDGGADGFDFYRRIIQNYADIVADNGIMAFEVGYTQAAAVADMMSDRFSVEIIKDLCGADRVVLGVKK